jgi:hypothetical protein
MGSFPLAMAGCSGAAATPPTMTRAAAPSWMARGSIPGSILYVSDPYLGVVNVYDASRKNPNPIGQLAGFDDPGGVFVDTGRNLWVANTNDRTIVAYREGALFPFKVLIDPSGFPESVCTSPINPTIYAVERDSLAHKPSQTILLYERESDTPTTTLVDPNAEELHGCAVDHAGNVFVTLTSASGGTLDSGEIDEFKRGNKTPTVIATGLIDPTGITIDKLEELVVSDTLAHEVLVYPPPYTDGPSVKLKTRGLVVGIALDERETKIWFANSSEGVAQQYSYPAGRLENQTQATNLYQPTGVALSPRGAP